MYGYIPGLDRLGGLQTSSLLIQGRLDRIRRTSPWPVVPSVAHSPSLLPYHRTYEDPHHRTKRSLGSLQ